MPEDQARLPRPTEVYRQKVDSGDGVKSTRSSDADYSWDGWVLRRIFSASRFS